MQPGFGRFRPQSVGEILDSAFSLYRRNFLLFVLIAAFVEIPSLILTLISTQVLGSAGFKSLETIGSGGQRLTQDQINQAIGDLVVVIAVAGGLLVINALVIGPIGVAATSRAVSDRYLDRPATVGSAFTAAFRRIGGLLGMSTITLFLSTGPPAVVLLAAVLVTPLLLIPVIPAIIVYEILILIRFALAAQVLVLENLGPVAALRRSHHLVKGFAWRIIGLGLLLIVIGFVLGLTLGALGQVFSSPFDATTRSIMNTVTGAIIAVFINPVTYATLTLLYYDIRIRREAFDVEMLARSL